MELGQPRWSAMIRNLPTQLTVRQQFGPGKLNKEGDQPIVCKL
jgi:hypothetical protein